MERHILLALIARTRKPIFTAAEDVALTSAALLQLAPYLNAQETRAALLPLRKFAHHDPAILQAALSETEVNPAVALHGRRLALVVRAMPAGTSAALQTTVASTAINAFAAGAWAPSDLRIVAAHVRRHGALDNAFISAVVAYVRAALPAAAPADLPVIVSLVSSLPEVVAHPAKLLDAAAERCVAVAEVLTPGAIGLICGQLNRTAHLNAHLVVVFQEEADRCAEKGDAFTAVQLFCFIARHKAEHISADALTWLMERIASEELDVASVESVCSALVHLPQAPRHALRQELTDFAGYIALQARDLMLRVPAENGGLCGSTNVEAVQSFVSHVLELAAVPTVYPELKWPPEVLEVVDACVQIADPLQEDLLSAEAPPFGLMAQLLEGPTEKCKLLGAAMLREASSRCMPLPALQVFRFLLAVGNPQQLCDAATLVYLRDQFAKTAADIPPAQLCTALRCLDLAAHGRNAGDGENAKEEEEEQLSLFLQLCTEKARKHMSEGASLRCVMSATEHLYKLGCRDTAFFADVAAYVEMKRDAVPAETASADAAAAVRVALGDDLLKRFPEVHEYLLAVEQSGAKGEASLTPSQWMNLHDPSSTLDPLTQQQQESWDIIEEMVRTRADDTAALTALAERYLVLLPHTRPDDHKYFFGVFEEKVLKEDKLLKQCLDAVIDSGQLAYLSAPTIAGILQSLAAVRFKYFASTKRFIASITAEQWMAMEAAPLVQILVGMEKLSLRNPAVLQQIGNRVDVLCRFLVPGDTACAIRAFQALGHNDTALLTKLMTHAAASARRFDEMSMVVLFSAPSIHRLMVAPAVAHPLLLQASAKIHSPHRREKISAWVRRSSLPREMIESTTARLQLTSKGATRGQDTTLRLT